MVAPDLVCICPKGPLAAGKPTWTLGLQVWVWKPALHQLRTYRLTPAEATTEGFTGSPDEPLKPTLEALQAFAAKDLPATDSYALDECKFALISGDLVEVEVAGVGSPPFRLARTMGFHL